MSEAVGATTPTELDSTWLDELQSIPDLKQAVLDAQTTDRARSVFLGHALRNIKGQSTPMLLHRLATVEHPMTAWALHVELDARHVPPCLRPWMSEVSRQSTFVATLADLRWLASRHPGHVAKYQRYQGVFRYGIGDDRWHKAALWAYRQCRGVRHTLAARLGLTESMRCHTLTMPDAGQRADRKLLRKNLQTIRETMIIHGLNHPDKSKATTPEHVADRRITLVSTFVLLGRNQKETVECLKSVADVSITRQTLRRQLEAAAITGDAARIVFGPYGRRC